MDENLVPESLYEAIIAYYENKLSQEQTDELITWLEKDKKNQTDFLETGKIWYASGLLCKEEKDLGKAWKKLVEKINENGNRPLPKPVVHIRVATIYKFAAAILILIAIGVGSIFVNKNPRQIFGSEAFEAAAPRGSRSVITLSDGSIVWLNSGTTLKYMSDFGKYSRDVVLDGEAFFNIAENKEIPFKVKTSELCITAIGTSFNVKAYSDEKTIETTLETGKIRIDNLDTKGQDHAPGPVFLNPNQKAVYIKSSGRLSLASDEQALPVKKNESAVMLEPPAIRIDSLVDTKLSTSWKDSRWIFKSEKLVNLVPILERRYDVKITFMDSVLVNYKFTGTLNEESLKQVLNALTIAAPIRYEVSENNIYMRVDKEQINRYMR